MYPDRRRGGPFSLDVDERRLIPHDRRLERGVDREEVSSTALLKVHLKSPPCTRPA